MKRTTHQSADRTREVMTRLMEARTIDEANDAVKGLPVNPWLVGFVEMVKHRIRTIEAEKRRLWGYRLN